MRRKLSLVAEGICRRFATMKAVKDYDVVYVFREAACWARLFLNAGSIAPAFR